MGTVRCLYCVVDKIAKLHLRDKPQLVRNVEPILLYSLYTSFSSQFLLIVFHWRKSLQLPRILADFDTVVVRMISVIPLISNFISLFLRPLETVSSAPTIIGITITFMFYSSSAIRQDRNICKSFPFLSFFFQCLLEWQNPLVDKVFYSC